MQSDMPSTVIWSKQKPEMEFQYGRHLFFQTGNSYNSDVDWAITTKFGLLIHMNLLKRTTSANPKPEVKLVRSGCHLENRYNIISPLRVVRFGWNLAARCKMTCRVLVRSCGRNRNWKCNVEFQYGGRLFFQTGFRYKSDVDWAIAAKFGLLMEDSDVGERNISQSETGSKIAPQRPPLWNR